MKYIVCRLIWDDDNSCIRTFIKKRYDLPTIPKLVCFIDNIIIKSNF